MKAGEFIRRLLLQIRLSVARQRISTIFFEALKPPDCKRYR